jgi:CBS domain containing-hemolysin-like protein
MANNFEKPQGGKAIMESLLMIIIAFLLVFLNGFFVAAEFGMVKLRQTKIQELKSKHGMQGYILSKVHRHLDSYLSACQLGITLASLGLGWIGEPAFAEVLEPLFVFFGLTSPQITKVTAFAIAFAMISFLHIVIGELMPKSLAIRQSEKISLMTAIPLYGFYWAMFPAIWFLNYCSNYLLAKTGLESAYEGKEFHSTDEIKLILNSSHLQGELTIDETEILEHTLDLADLNVTEVMRPKNDMIMLNTKEPIENIFQKIRETRYSRYPVHDNNKNEIIGVVHVKDLFSALLQKKEVVSLFPFVRPILKVMHKLPAMDLLRKFRDGMPHFALVYKDKNTLLGFVTLDNLLHVMIGRIQDEFNKTQDDWVKNSDGSFSFKGECSLYSLERALDCNITLTADEEEVDTLAGLILTHHGIMPKEGDIIDFREFRATIELVQGSYIKKIRVIPNAISLLS